VRGATSTRLSRIGGGSREDGQKLFVLHNIYAKLVTLRSDPAAIQVRFVLLSNLWSDIIQLMRTRMSRAAVMIVLLTCVVCPVLETFDDWDHTLQTGHDTEYTFVLLALCVGAVYALVRLIATLGSGLSSISIGRNSPHIQGSLFFLIHTIALDSASGSRPVNLRI
jgi:hypothetical protein